MNSNGRLASLCALFSMSLLGLAYVGCGGGGGGGGVIGPSPTTITGDYALTANETTDTCNMGFPAQFSFAAHVQQNGSDVQVTERNSSGACVSYLYQMNGNTFTKTGTDTFTLGTCTLQESLVSTLTASGTHLSGTESYHFSYVSGDCAGLTACDYVLQVQGNQCQGCWSGCSAAAMSRSSAGGILETPRADALSSTQAKPSGH